MGKTGVTHADLWSVAWMAAGSCCRGQCRFLAELSFQRYCAKAFPVNGLWHMMPTYLASLQYTGCRGTVAKNAWKPRYHVSLRSPDGPANEPKQPKTPRNMAPFPCPRRDRGTFGTRKKRASLLFRASPSLTVRVTYHIQTMIRGTGSTNSQIGHTVIWQEGLKVRPFSVR